MADESNSATMPKIHPDTQESDPWSDEFNISRIAYLEAEAALSACERSGIGDKGVLKYIDRRDDATWGLIRARTPNKWMLVEKMHLLLRLMLDGDWTDRRDLVLAASILRDVEQWRQES